MSDEITKENINDIQKHNSRVNYKISLLLNSENRLEMAKQFHKTQPFFWDNSIFWFWNFESNKYEMLNDIQMMNLIDEECKVASTINSTQKKEIIEGLRRVGCLKRPLDAPNTWIQFKNCVLDIKTGERHSIKPDYFFTNPIPWDYDVEDVEKGFTQYLEDGTKPDPLACPFDELFEQWVGKANVDMLYEIIGYCMLADYPLHRIFCFNGSGLNGKGTFLTILEKVIGNYNCASTELDDLMSNRFATARLYKKLACLMGETNFNAMNKTSMLKKLCGGDLIGYEFKNKDPFQDINYAKLLIATNSLPITHDKTKGFYRRWLIIDFPNQFSEKKDILADFGDPEYKSLVRKAVNALKKIIKLREFTNEGSIEERMKRYEDRSNPLAAFIEKYTVRDECGDIPKFEFQDRFTKHLKDNGYREMSSTAIGIEMKQEYTAKKLNKGFNEDGKEKWWNCWLGLKWKPIQEVLSTTAEDPNFQTFPSFHTSSLHSIPHETKSNSIETLETLESFIKEAVKRRKNGISHEDLLTELILHYKDQEIAEKKIKVLLESGDLFQIKPGIYKILE